MFRMFGSNDKHQEADEHTKLITLKNIQKAYKTDAGDFLALKGIDLTIDKGEFVGIIGKSGSGKSTLVNMVTGIDRPTHGEVYINQTGIHNFSEDQMARWRGVTLGVVFQFFQLLPTLTVLENVMLPMDFCNLYTRRERYDRAMQLLEAMDVSAQAHKLPTMISGGQQQRVAIARALANDPPVIVADEPTGNLDSRTAHQVFELFENLVAEGKTFLMVTHDDELAQRVSRTVVIADGEIVNEWLLKALPTLSQEQLVTVNHQLEPVVYAPGELIYPQDSSVSDFHIVTSGQINAYTRRANGTETLVETLPPGDFFGEMALLNGSTSHMTMRATTDQPVEVLKLSRDHFLALLNTSPETETLIQRRIAERRETLGKEAR